MRIGDHLICHGPAGGAVEYGEYYKVFELLRHAYTEPNGTAYIGDWARVVHGRARHGPRHAATRLPPAPNQTGKALPATYAVAFQSTRGDKTIELP